MAIYAVGDIQGCYDSLRRLLDRCHFDPKKDRLWLVGDLVNRGPRSLETLRFVKSLGDAALTVLGNHDLSLIMLAEGFGKRGKDDTLDEVLAAPDREELLFWLRHQPLMHLEDGYVLVHAGLLPQWSPVQARALAREVESALQGENFRDCLAHLWGSEPNAWDDGLTGWERLRVVVNAMTRMRFCSPKGVMEFKAKGKVSNAPKGYLPWFAVPERRSRDVTIVCGHWSALGLHVEPNLMALDSGCLWGGCLTAMKLPKRKIYQVDCAPGEAVPQLFD